MTNSIHNQIYELALEKCAGDEAQATAFTESFLKKAFFGGELGKEVLKGAGGMLGKGVAGLGVGLGIYGLSTALSSMADSGLHAKFEAALKQVIASNEILRHAEQEHPGRIMSFAGTLQKFGPHLVCDPNILAHLLINAVHGDSIDVATIKTVSELENRYTDNRRNSLFSPKTFA